MSFSLYNDYIFDFSLGSLSFSFYTCFFQLLLICSICVILFTTNEFLKYKKILNFEYDLLFNFSVLGLLLIGTSNDVLTFYLAIELQSLCFYVLACFVKRSSHSSEAALKYFVLGSVSSGLLLFSFCSNYSYLGTTHFDSIELMNSLTSSLGVYFGTIFFRRCSFI